jgi:hypothetical protein
LISFIKLTLEQIKNKITEQGERKERELRREREEGRKAADRLTLFFSTNKYVFVSNKFEIHLLMQGMTGFFDCTGHLLLFGWMMFVFIFMARSPL